jgi:hypothetical protein
MTTARRGAGGGLPFPGGAHAQGGGEAPRNLRMVFETLSAPAEAAPRLDAGSPPLKRSKITQALIDIGALLFGCLFVASASVGAARPSSSCFAGIADSAAAPTASLNCFT